MFSRTNRVTTLCGIVFLLAATVLLIQACGGISPYASLFFAQNSDLTTIERDGIPADDDEGDDTDETTLDSVCDLEAQLRTLRVTIENESAQAVEFSMTFVASAGAGGFVCDDVVNDYLSAGYTDAGATAVIGCDTVSLGGNRLLIMEFGVNQGAGARIPAKADPDDESADNPNLDLRRRDTGSLDIPLPELIVLGGDDPDFICTGGAQVGDLCTQRGFIYVNAGGVSVGKPANASRIQGTICNEGFGTAPEWRLDKTLEDGFVQAFQYTVGGSLVVTVLNRSSDAVENNRNQVVWLVTNESDNTVHFPDR